MLTVLAADPVSPSKTDVDFINQATAAGLTEIRAADLALKRNLTPQEKAFANEIIEDHTKANKELAKIAKTLSVPTPDDISSDEQGKLVKMSNVPDKDFNQSYLDNQIDCHKKAIDLFESEKSSTMNADLKQYIVTTLPHLKMHYDTAKQLAARY